MWRQEGQSLHLCVAQLLEVVEQNLKLPYTKPAILTANHTVMRMYKDMYLDTVMSLVSRATCNHARSTFTQVAYQTAHVLLER